LTPIFLKIVIMPILDELILTLLILIFELLHNTVRTIKKAAELMSEGIL